MQWRWWKRKKNTRIFRLGSKKTDTARRIDLSRLTPTVADLVAHGGATSSLIAAEYQELSEHAWSAQDRDELARASGAALERYEGLRAVLADYVEDPVDSMAEPLEYQRAQFALMRADNWYERIATCVLAGGFLLDFYRIMVDALPERAAKQLRPLLDSRPDEDLAQQVLERVFAVDVAYRSRVSLWGRRLIGDTMLIARHALRTSESGRPGQAQWSRADRCRDRAHQANGQPGSDGVVRLARPSSAGTGASGAVRVSKSFSSSRSRCPGSHSATHTWAAVERTSAISQVQMERGSSPAHIAIVNSSVARPTCRAGRAIMPCRSRPGTR